MSRIIEHFCRSRDQMNIITQLTHNLEESFNFKISDYNLASALLNLYTQVLIVHDEQDEDIPISDALDIKETHKDSRFLMTKGSGHKRILMNREVLKIVKEFLNS